MAFPQGFIEELKLRNPIEEVVSQYATLKRAGSNMVCCCPFHSEKTPSFTVFSSNKNFYCFGCGAGGDVITFIMKIENLDYLAAIEFLANRAGIPVPQDSGFAPKVDKKRFYEMNAKAARFWYNNLFSEKGKPCLDYLLGRGLNKSTITRFGIGFASDSFDELTGYLQKEGYKKEEITEAFLGGTSTKTGKVFDLFRNRAIFPVIDVSGNVVAFSGRFVGKCGENDRKYFNSNDTPVFKKRNTVFSLNIAKNYPDKSLILCEGNMDAVSLHMAGISNAVASLGTALTPEQCRLMSRYADTVYICYDSDEAGKRATKKAIRLLGDAGLKVKVISLDGKDTKDPDDYIRKYGKAKFEERVKAAKGAIEYQFDEIKNKYDLSKMDDKNAFISECTELLSSTESDVEREIFIVAMKEATNVDASILKQKVNSKIGSNIKEEQSNILKKEMNDMRGYGNKPNPEKAKFLSKAVKEEGIIGILLLRSEYLTDKKIRPFIDPEVLKTEFSKRFVTKLLELTENDDFEFSALNEFFTPDEIGDVERMKQKRRDLENNTPEVLKELFDRLRAEKEKEELKNETISNEWLEKLRKEKK